MKTSTCRDGTLTKTKWEWHYNTLVPFCQLCTPQKHISLFTPTKCHQCAMHTLTTRSEIELLDTRYVASTRIHTTIHHCSISCIDSVLSGLLWQLLVSLPQPVEVISCRCHTTCRHRKSLIYLNYNCPNTSLFWTCLYYSKATPTISGYFANVKLVLVS